MKQLFKKIKAWYKDNCQRPDDWENMSAHDRKVFTISAWAACSMVMCPFLVIIIIALVAAIGFMFFGDMNQTKSNNTNVTVEIQSSVFPKVCIINS